jgi:hypothetical protein
LLLHHSRLGQRQRAPTTADDDHKYTYPPRIVMRAPRGDA